MAEQPIVFSELARLGEREREVHELKMKSGVPASEVYERQGQHAPTLTERRAWLKVLIAATFTDSDKAYGYRRIHAELARRGFHAGPELVR